MADRIKGITIEIGGDSTGLSKSLEGVNKSLKTCQNQLNDVNKLLKFNPHSAELLKQKHDILNESIKASSDKLAELKAKEKDMEAAVKVGSVSEEQYNAYQREIVETESKLNHFKEEIKKVPNASNVAFAQMGESLDKVGNKTKAVGEGMTKYITTTITAIGAGSMAAFSEVDTAMDTVATKTGATGKSLESMQKSVENLATSIPTSFETAGTAVGEVNTRFGLTGKALEDLSGQFIKFAEINNTDVNTSIDNVSSVLHAFNMDSSQASDVLDVLNVVGQQTGISMDTLASAMSSNAASLQEMGLNAGQSAQLLGQFEMSGMDTSAAMMGLKTALKNAASDGVSLTDALADWQKEMQGTGSETDKLNATIDLFGSKAGAQFYNAAQNGKINLESLNSDMSTFSGSVKNTFEETEDPIDKFKTTMNELKIAGAEIGTSLGEMLGPALKNIASGLKDINEWWNTLSPGTQQSIIILAMILAALGPILTMLGNAIIVIGGVSTALGVMNIAAGPVGLVILGIVAAITMVIAIMANWDEICNMFSAGFTTFGNMIGVVVEKIKGFFVGIGDFFKNNWKDLLLLITNPFLGAFNLLYKNCDSFRNKIDALVNSIKGFFKNLVLDLPKIKLPHFSIKGNLSLNPPSVPHMAIDWYDKAMRSPILLSGATMFGVNAQGQAMVGGETGTEIITSAKDYYSKSPTINNSIVVNGYNRDPEELSMDIADRINFMTQAKEAAWA